MIDRFNTHYNTNRTTSIIPLAHSVPSTTETREPIISTVKLAKGYTLEIDTMQLLLMPEQMLSLLEASRKHPMIYGGDRSITFVHTTTECQHNGRTLTRIMQSYTLKVLPEVVRALEHYFQMTDLHQYLQAYQSHSIYA